MTNVAEIVASRIRIGSPGLERTIISNNGLRHNGTNGMVADQTEAGSTAGAAAVFSLLTPVALIAIHEATHFLGLPEAHLAAAVRYNGRWWWRRQQ